MTVSRTQNPELSVLLLGWIQGLYRPPGSPTPMWKAFLCLNPIFEASANYWNHRTWLDLQLRYMAFSLSLISRLLPSASLPSLPSMPHFPSVKEERGQ